MAFFYQVILGSDKLHDSQYIAMNVEWNVSSELENMYSNDIIRSDSPSCLEDTLDAISRSSKVDFSLFQIITFLIRSSVVTK